MYFWMFKIREAIKWTDHWGENYYSEDNKMAKWVKGLLYKLDDQSSMPATHIKVEGKESSPQRCHLISISMLWYPSPQHHTYTPKNNNKNVIWMVGKSQDQGFEVWCSMPVTQHLGNRNMWILSFRSSWDIYKNTRLILFLPRQDMLPAGQECVWVCAAILVSLVLEEII